MTITRWIILTCSVLLGLWMTFDGLRAFVTGNYTVPSTGQYAGQLGPWTAVFKAMGISPLHGGVKALFVALGISWLAAAALLLAGHPQALRAALAVAICSLWYLPFGTALSVVVIVLFFVASR